MGRPYPADENPRWKGGGIPAVRDPQSSSTNPAIPGDVSLNPRHAIAQSVEARETSRIGRLHRTLGALLESTCVNPPVAGDAFDQLLGTILDAVMDASQAHMGNLQLFDPVTQSLRIRVHRGFSPEFVTFFNSVQHGTLACGTAFARGEPVVVENVESSPLFTPETLRVVTAAGVRAVQSLALINRGRKLGVISVHYRSPTIALRNREAFASTATLIAEIVAAGSPARIPDSQP